MTKQAVRTMIRVALGAWCAFALGCNNVAAPTAMICVPHVDAITGRVFLQPASGSRLYGPDGKIACSQL